MDIKRSPAVFDRFWHAILDRSFEDVPRPTDAPFAHSTGRDPHRVLVFGSGTAVGWGLRSHQLALPGQLARELGEGTSRGIDVDLIADRRITAFSAVEAIAGRMVEPYDAIVVSLGMTDSLRLLRPATFHRRMRVLLTALSARTADSARLVLLGMQPVQTIPMLDSRCGGILDLHTQRLDRVLRELSEEFPKVDYVAMTAPGTATRDSVATADDYRRWARDIALRLAPALEQASAGGVGWNFVADDRVARQRALHELTQLGGHGDGRLERIADLARSLFATDIATISLLDADRHWMIAASGMERIEMPTSRALSAHAMTSRSAFIVPDITKDPRFGDTQAASMGLRFYAGYPIQSAGGQAVGTLAVLDTAPRRKSTVDVELLRDLAMVAQHELWAPQAVSA